MRKAVLAMLLAAGALVPGLASAQDGGRFREGSRGAQMWAQRHTQHTDAGDRAQFTPPAPQQPQAQAPQAQPQQRPAFSADRGQWRRDGGDRGPRNWGNRDGGARPAWQGQPPVQQPTPQPPAVQQGWNRGGQDRGSWQHRDGQDRGNWQHRDGDDRGNWQRGDRDNGAAVQNWQRRDRNGRDYGAGRGYVPNQPSTGWQRDRADWRDNYRDGRRFNDREQWNRGWRSDNRYDWNHYRYSNRNAFHMPRYYAPYGWNSYRRFSIGVTLNSLLFAEQYWLDDPYDYRLPEAYGPYRWVRYYNDALLVNTYDGEVVDVVYDIFW